MVSSYSFFRIVSVKAAAVARMAGRTDLVYLRQERIIVAVDPQLFAHTENVRMSAP